MKRAGILIGLLAGCGANSVAGPAIPAPANRLRAEDRVLIGDFSRVLALASTTDRVYVVYPQAVATWRPLEHRWDPPSAPEPASRLLTATLAVADPSDRTLWLAGNTLWLHFDPLSNRWETGVLPGTAVAIATDVRAPGGVWIRTTVGWVTVSRLGGIVTPGTPPATLRPPPSLQDAMLDLPALRASAPRIATGPQLTQGALTAAAPDPLGNGWFVGTTTRGLVFVDRTSVDATPITLGLRGNVVGAIAPAPNGVWVATDADPEHVADVTLLAADLSISAPIDAGPVRGPPFTAIRRILPIDNGIWLATDRGVMRVRNSRIDRFDVGRGLSDDRVNSLAIWRERLVAGTQHGVSLLQGDTLFTRPFASFQGAAYAVAARGDTLWVGTADGLFAAVGDDTQLRMPEGFRQLGIVEPVLDIGYVADTMVVMTPNRLIARDPNSGAWQSGPVLSDRIGQLVAFTASERGVVVGGETGAAILRPLTPALRILPVPAILPGSVTSVVLSGQFLWIGTNAGLVRLMLEP